MSDVKQSVGRLRQTKRFGGKRTELSVYGGKWGAPYERDKNAVVDEYLAEHLPDDAEPVTVEWWKELTGDSASIKIDEDNRILFGEVLGVQLEMSGFTLDFHTVTTRGQLRRLVKLLKGDS